MTTTATETTITRAELKGMAADFLADPSNWPAAMAARAVRLASGHPVYSSGNQALIVSQLWGRFCRAGLDEDAAFDAAFSAMAQEIAPASVWAKRGYVPVAGSRLAIWSRPINLYVDNEGNRSFSRERLAGESVDEMRVFTVESTYLASDVRNAAGDDATGDYTAPELTGDGLDVYERLSAWITGQGWTVRRTGSERELGAANGATSHMSREIRIHGGLTGWAAVETLAHEVAHALLHGANDDRPYAGEHRGDIEAEAESVAFALLVAMGQHDAARGAVRYAAEWTRSAERVAVAFDRASHVVDAVVTVALGTSDEPVVVRESAKAVKAAAKASNRQLAADMRAAGLEPKGEAWRLAKAGVPLSDLPRAC